MNSVNGVPVADRAGAVRELLRQRAVAAGLVAADANDRQLDEGIDMLLEREVVTPAPDEDECRRYYTQNQARFVAGELVMVRHILFAVTPGVPLAPLRQRAEQALHELCEQPERFAERARALSNCPSGARDEGRLGQLSRGACVPEFEQAIFGTPALGVLRQLVRTRYGFHIVAIDQRIAGLTLPFAAVHQTIAAQLSVQVTRKALEQYVALLAGQADICGVELTRAESPLMQ
jgi:peptidyl-prolyl cis-trans isomerase C